MFIYLFPSRKVGLHPTRAPSQARGDGAALVLHRGLGASPRSASTQPRGTPWPEIQEWFGGVETSKL